MLKQPHEILGIAKDATADQITQAFNRLAPRCNPQFHPGNDLMAYRFKRLREAYDVMIKARTEEDRRNQAPPRQTAFNYRPESDHFEFAQAARIIESRRRKTKGEEAAETFNKRVRINRLVKEWNKYASGVYKRHETVSAIKTERGLSFTYLKSVFGRSDEARQLWAAEDYLRRGYEEATGLHYNFRSLGIVVNELRHYLRNNEVAIVREAAIELAEEDLRYRVIMFDQALQILKGKGPQP